MKKIGNIIDLPAWYSRAAYDGTATFKAKEWYRELAVRKELLDLWKRYRSTFNEGGADNLVPDKCLVELTKAIQKQPLDTIFPKNELFEDVLSYQLEIPRQKNTVRTLTFADLAYQKRLDSFAEESGILSMAADLGWTSEHVSACWSALNAKTYNSDENLDVPVNFTEYLLSSFPRAGLLVDLDAPDSLLIAEFKDWLATARPTMFKPKPDRPALYGRWERYGLLPYLDLTIWAVAEDANIIDKVMAQAISKHHNIGEENVRKTVAPLAGRTYQLIKELRIAITIESAAETST